MIVPNESMNVRFTDDRISQILRAGVDRDVIRTMKDHIITMNNVSFGLANRILKVTPIEVDTSLEIGVENWVKILCGDEDALLNVYTYSREPKKEEPIAESAEEHAEEVKVEEIIEPEQPEEEVTEEAEVETLDEEEVSGDEQNSESDDKVEAPVEEESTEETAEETVDDEPISEEEVVDETPVFVTGMSTDLDPVDNEVTGTLTTSTTTDESAAIVAATHDPSIKHVENTRRPVNVNNNRKHKHH